MQLDLDNLPSDVALLQRLVRDMAEAVTTHKGEIDRLKTLIKQLQRMQFGKRSERLDPDQLALALEDLGADIGRVEESAPLPSPAPESKPKRKPLPEHLPREDVVVDVDGPACPCCGGALHPIGDSVSEMLDWVPAQLKVIRITRPKYACRSCQRIAQAPAPERPIAGGLATPGLAEAIRYALTRWDGLTRFLTDGRVDLDTNPVERAIRPITLGRKNHLFAGSDGGGERWAVVASMIETAKLNGVEPYAWLKDVLTRMVAGHPVNRLDELLPWAWKPEKAVNL